MDEKQIFLTVFMGSQFLNAITPIKYLMFSNKLGYAVGALDIFCSLARASVLALLTYVIKDNFLHVPYAFILLLYLACLIKMWAKRGRWENVVYNSVIILNTMWYLNRQGEETICIAASVIAFITQLVKAKSQFPEPINLFLSSEYLGELIANIFLYLYCQRYKRLEYLSYAALGMSVLSLLVGFKLVLYRKARRQKTF